MRGTDVRIFVNNLDISGDTAEVGIETTTEEYESATLTSTIADYAPGINSGQITVNGYVNGVVAGFENALQSALAASGNIVMAVLDFQNLPAPTFVAEDAHENSLAWSMPVDGLITLDGAFKGRRGLKRGKMLEYKTTRSATGAGSAMQLADALSTMNGKGYVVLHSVSGSQATPITVKIQSSVNGVGGWTDEASFSFSDVGAQAVVITAPVGEYFNLNVTSLGGATSAVFSWVVSLDGLT